MEETCEMYAKFWLENSKSLLGRPKWRWEDNIKIHISCEHDNEVSGFIKVGT